MRSGSSPAMVCGDLAVRAPQWVDAALAVGSALGIEEPELRQRLGGEPQVASEFRPGEEDLYAEVLVEMGVFDVPKRLDAREEVIAEHLRAALRAQGGLGGGYFHNLQRAFVKGELARVFRSLTRFGPRAGRGRPAEFWTALIAAGELLDPADGDDRGTVGQALEACRRGLADCADWPARSGRWARRDRRGPWGTRLRPARSGRP
ncbi:hypothetical protein ACH4E7_17210 [Kitasatospora sp. NPDC018058]|uniref:hypothetical protein n=1 Tax=Kitasatospora sp. NPDC018058 TaxID=3364025 RepID=UPI0037C02E16